MTIQDPIADMLTRIRNAQLRKRSEVEIPYSRHKEAIARVLAAEGYIGSCQEEGAGPEHRLKLQLKYHRERPVIDMLRRVSKPSCRVYRRAADLPRVRSGLGMAVVSTSRGVMTDSEARTKGLGGEVLCLVA